MDMNNLSLGFDEGIVFALRELYEKYGFSHYRMSKFEEYDLYAKNKDFLISDSVITFTDMDGRLLALKPDVTLSIVKNLNDTAGFTQKLYYNENVYRVGKGNRSFKEIMQTGLEAFGDIDTYTLCEVITLAVQSLKTISDDCVLDISNLDILSAVMEKIALPEGKKGEFMRLVGEKNTHELAALLNESDISEADASKVIKLVSTCGTADKVLPEIKALLSGFCDEEPIDTLSDVLSSLEGDSASRIRIDFSVVDNTKYYNGIVFKGFIKGVPTAVLSGGQYNRLMKRLGRNCGALGFAVYHDTLDRLYDEYDGFDVDALVIYGDNSPRDISGALAKLRAEGFSVMAQKKLPQNIKYRRLYSIEGENLKELENNA